MNTRRMDEEKDDGLVGGGLNTGRWLRMKEYEADTFLCTAETLECIFGSVSFAVRSVKCQWEVGSIVVNWLWDYYMKGKNSFSFLQISVEVENIKEISCLKFDGWITDRSTIANPTVGKATAAIISPKAKIISTQYNFEFNVLCLWNLSSLKS